jgi:hypothetical protein
MHTLRPSPPSPSTTSVLTHVSSLSPRVRIHQFDENVPQGDNTFVRNRVVSVENRSSRRTEALVRDTETFVCRDGYAFLGYTLSPSPVRGCGHSHARPFPPIRYENGLKAMAAHTGAVLRTSTPSLLEDLHAMIELYLFPTTSVDLRPKKERIKTRTERRALLLRFRVDRP